MKPIVILGIFVADTAYRAARQPRLGETVLGQGFALGPGGKGSNQSVAAAMSGFLFMALLIRTGSLWVPIVYHALWVYAPKRKATARIVTPAVARAGERTLES